METSSRLQLLKPRQVHAALISNSQLKSHEVHADMTRLATAWHLFPGVMLKEGAILALALCCIVIVRHGNLCLPLCLGRWRFVSLEDLTAHFELLCSDPADLAIAIAIFGMLMEDRPSRMRLELLFEHLIGACTLQRKNGSKYPCCLEPNYTIFIDSCFLMLERRFGRLEMLAQHGLTTRRSGCSSGCKCGAHVCSKFFRRHHGRPDCWHLEFVTSEAVSELWTWQCREWSLKRRARHVRHPPKHLTKKPQKGQQNRAQRHAMRSCVISVLRSKDTPDRLFIHQLTLEMYRTFRAFHVFQQGLSEVQEAWLNSTCNTV